MENKKTYTITEEQLNTLFGKIDHKIGDNMTIRQSVFDCIKNYLNKNCVK
jgi:hypothetical protein